MIGSINSSSMIQSLFSKLDTSNKGYLEKSDLTSAFSGISSSSDSTSSIDNLFSSLDDDSDGKVSSDEFSSNVSTLLQSLNAQMASGMNGMRPPPPPPAQGDSGFSKGELQAQLEEIGDSDSQRSSLISSILENFDSADSDSDGKVSFQEAMAYGQSSDTTSSATSTTSSSSTASSEQELTRMILQLMQAYGGNDNVISSRLSALA